MQKLAFIGFGVVGEGLAEILMNKRDDLRDRYGFEYSIVAVSDFKKGSAYNPDGLDPEKLLQLANAGSISEYPEAQTGLDALTTIEESNADTVVEVTYTDIETGQPAYQHFRAALESGKNLVTTNKGPTALFLDELTELARSNEVEFRYEGTVMAGTPVLNLCESCLAGNTIREIRGILNGTTNYILTNMEEGKAYQEVLKKAQELGYAEADPTADVEGYDALAKVVILARSVLNAGISPSDVKRTGITGIKPEDVEEAKKEGKSWKLIGRVTAGGGIVSASVKPEKIDRADPLASVGGATNALTFDTDLLGDVTIVGAGAGKTETGFSLLSDILAIHNRTAR